MTTWRTADYGWFGALTSAIEKADTFDRFTRNEREALGRITAEKVELVLAQSCDAQLMRPTADPLHCDKNLGHLGEHHAPATPDPCSPFSANPPITSSTTLSA